MAQSKPITPDSMTRGPERRADDRRSEDRRQVQAPIAFPDRRAEDRRTGERRSGLDRRDG